MKANRNSLPPAFEPVILTLETQAEVDALYTLINHFRISNTVGLGNVSEGILQPFRDSAHCSELHRALGLLLNK